MDKFTIEGGVPLNGTIRISGAKNAALPLMAACLLTDQPLRLKNVPDLADITSMVTLLQRMGVEIMESEHEFTLQAHRLSSIEAPYELVRKMRASIAVLGPLVARHGEARVSLPGGCALGARSVDLHLKALEALGAHISLEHGYIHATVPKGLRGSHYTFPLVTVMGTENLLMAASLATGTTIIDNAACEPEVVDLGHCLQTMGAKIQGLGTRTITVEGVSTLSGCTHTVIPDRLELASYAIAAGITEGDLFLTHGDPGLLPTAMETLRSIGVGLEERDGVLHAFKAYDFRPAAIVTQPYPGFPTDIQAQTMALLCLSPGISHITETIFENRFMHVPELTRMGAKLSIEGHAVTIEGIPHFESAEVMATDIRASMSLILAALNARGTTTLNRIYHLDRGYETLEKKLNACGARIRRISE